MMKYEFLIARKPKGKERPRFGNGHVYTPKATKEYEQYIKSQYKGPYFEGAVTVRILAGYTPKADTDYPLKTPDADNVAKLVCDSLNGIAYKDDRQVVNLIVSKRWTDVPFMRVYIEEAT